VSGFGAIANAGNSPLAMWSRALIRSCRYHVGTTKWRLDERNSLAKGDPEWPSDRNVSSYHVRVSSDKKASGSIPLVSRSIY
jgi:hypothetical protein